MNYYKITKEQADLIGKIMYAEDRMFDPYVGEQKDGTYIVSEEMYQIMKDHTDFKKVDFSKKTPITENEVKTDMK